MSQLQKNPWLSYEEVSLWAQSENIMTQQQWVERCAQGLPDGIPSDPERTYGGGFGGWNAFLGVQLSRDGRKNKAFKALLNGRK